MQLLWCLRPECNVTFLVMFQATFFNHAFTLQIVACINVHANLKGRHMQLSHCNQYCNADHFASSTRISCRKLLKSRTKCETKMNDKHHAYEIVSDSLELANWAVVKLKASVLCLH